MFPSGRSFRSRLQVKEKVHRVDDLIPVEIPVTGQTRSDIDYPRQRWLNRQRRRKNDRELGQICKKNKTKKDTWSLMIFISP